MTNLSEQTHIADHLLRWWHRYQAHHLTREADAIRNGVLQELFALRRKIELMQQDPGSVPHTTDYDACLAMVEQLYTCLETLSNRLSSPYLQESLPLALQHELQPWQAQASLSLHLPGQWPPEPIEHIHLLLTLLKQLAKHVVEQTPHPAQFSLNLYQTSEGKSMMVELQYENSVPSGLEVLLNSRDWTSLIDTFRLLADGTVTYTAQSQNLTWHFQWS